MRLDLVDGIERIRLAFALDFNGRNPEMRIIPHGEFTQSEPLKRRQLRRFALNVRGVLLGTNHTSSSPKRTRASSAMKRWPK